MAEPEEPPKRPPRQQPPPKKPNGDNGDDQREPHEEEPEAVRIHEAYIERLRGGGEEPDAEARRRAIEEFERLPGALPTTPPVKPEEPADEDEEP
jgi:hypothetical protein